MGVVVGRASARRRPRTRVRHAVAAAAEVGAAERLADRGLVRLEPLRLLERDGRLRPVTLGDQREAALEELVRVLSWVCDRRSSALALARARCRAAAQLLHEVQHAGRDLLLGAARNVELAAARRGSRPRSGRSRSRCPAREMSFTTIASSPLRASFVAGPFDALGPVLGGEADHRLALAAHRRAASDSTSEVAHQVDRERVAALLGDLVVQRARRAEVRDRGRHQQQVGAREARERRVAQLRGGLDLHVARRRECAPARCWPRPRSPRRPAPAASAASANPMRPLERLPTKRTESSGSRVPPAVTSTRIPSSGRGAPPATISIAARIAAGSASRPTPHSPRDASWPVPGSITCTPRAAQHLEVGLRGRMLVHAVVHRRSDQHRAEQAR